MTPLRRSLITVVAVILIAATAYVVARSRRDFWDFEVYRTAGVRVVAGEPLYRSEDGHYQFKYWPAFAIAMIPFGLVGVEAGKIIWYALSVGWIALFLRQSIHALPERRSTVRFLTGWTLLLTGKFIVIELMNGQANALFGVLVILALVAAQRQRPMTAGALVGLAAFVKPYALVLLPWVVVTQGARASVSALAVLVAGWLLPAVRYGWQGNLDLLAAWYQTVVTTTPENLLVRENISFATMWSKWIGEGPTASTLALVMTLMSFAAVAVFWVARRRVREPSYVEVSYLLLLIPLISPQGWDYVLLLATPAIVCLVDRFRESPLPWRVISATGMVLTAFAIYDLMGRTLYFALMAASGVTIGALLLAASLIGLRLRSVA